MYENVTDEFQRNNDNDLDPSFFWLKAKTAIIDLAKKREKEWIKIENEKIEVLKGFYLSAMNDIKDGIDSFKEVNSIKLEMDKIYQERSKRKLDKRRAKEIDDQVYDIHKLQN